MSEIEKMYENAGFVKKRCKDYSCGVCEQYDKCEKYPPFTAEKQIELIKLLSKHFVNIDYDNGKYEVYVLSIGNLRYDYYDTLEETLAYCINGLWQDLTEEERKQIKEILE